MKQSRTNRLMALGLSLCLLVFLLLPSGTVLAAEQVVQQTAEGTRPVQIVQTIAPLTDGAASQTVEPGGAPVLPTEMICIVDGKESTPVPVTWECASFDADKPGEYTFTAKLPEGYALAEGAALPSITVTVAQQRQTQKSISAVNGLGDSARLRVPVGAEKEGFSLPAELMGTVDGVENTPFPVVWDCKTFKAGEVGEFTFTAKPGEGYSLMENTTLPAITVVVESDAAPFALRGAVNKMLYKINSAQDWSGLQDWLDNIADPGATVQINVAGQAGQEISIPNRNITIESTVSGAVEDLRLVSSAAVTLTIKNLYISFAPATFTDGAIDMAGGSTLKFAGTNKLESNKQNGGEAPVIHVPSGKTLTLTGVETASELAIKTSFVGAGIGGKGDINRGESCGNVKITGGKITVDAIHGAGIGGGGSNTTAGAGGTIEISGADTVVETIVTGRGAGIGGGGSNITGGAGEMVTITGGKVMVNAVHGSGIGGGGSNTTGGAGGTIEISGADTVVETIVTGRGAGIGGGGSNNAGGDGKQVTITGGTVTVNAVSGAGIGGGFGKNTAGGTGGTVEISGAETVVKTTVTSKGAGIGGGASNNTGGDGGIVTITGGMVTAKAKHGAGIGGGVGNTTGGSGGTVEISGVDTVVEAIATEWGAGIGGGGANTTGGNGGNVTITGGKVTAKSSQGRDIGGGYGRTGGQGGSLSIESTGETRTLLHMLNKGTNAALDHSIGTCQITDATGALTGDYSKLTVKNGVATIDHAQKDFWKPEIVRSEVTVIITADKPPQGQYFTGWTAVPTLLIADVKALITTFTMPETAQAVTASFRQMEAPVITGEVSKNVTYGYAATSSEAFTITGIPVPTVKLDKDYDGKLSWNASEKKLEIAAGLGVGAYPVKLTVENSVDPKAEVTFTLVVEGIAPVIASQPQDASYTAGQGAAPLKVTAQAKDDGTLAYQWYQNTADSNTGGTKIAEATGESYTPDTDSVGTAYYYCTVTSTYGGGIPPLSTVSDVAAVLVTIPGHEAISGPEGGKPLDLTKDAVFGFAGEYANLADIRLNGHSLMQTPTSGTQADLSGYPGYAPALGNAKSGSVMVTLYKDFLQTLPGGTYKLEVEFLDGGVTSVGSTAFEILREKPTPAPSDNPTPAPSTPSDVPATGDESTLWPWVLLATAALIGFAALLSAVTGGAYQRRCNHQYRYK